MGIARWVSIAAAALIAQLPQSSFAKKADNAPDPAAWTAEIQKNPTAIKGAYPFRVVLLSDLEDKGEPQYLNIDIGVLNEASYLRFVDTQNAAWDYKLNAARLKNKDPLMIAQLLTGADTALVASEGGQWRFMRYRRGKRQVLAEADAPRDQKPATIAAWLSTALGWDGVVIAQKDDSLLVGSTARILATPDIQALAVKDSANKFSLPVSRKGAGLLSLVKSSAGFGVFDIVFLGQGANVLPVGTKLIIEKRQKQK